MSKKTETYKKTLFSPGIAKLLFISLLALSVKTCEFESTGTWNKDIPEPTAEIPTAELNFKDSIIYIDQAIQFEYSLNFIKQEVYQVEFYLNGRELVTNTGPKGTVLINPLPGKYSFEMVIITSTESGSIADQTEAEAFFYSQYWTIYSENEEKSQIQIQAITRSEGSLLIEWDQYQGYMFQSYELIKKTTQGEIKLCELLELDQTSFFDEYYVGGIADYFIRLIKTNGKQGDGDIKSYSSTTGTIELDYNWEQHTLSISWPKCAYENNFEMYQLLQRLENDVSLLIYTGNDLTDTTVSVEVGENQDLRFELVYHSNMPNSTPSNGQYSISSENIFTGSFYLPESVPAFVIIAQSKQSPYRIYTPEFLYDVIEDRLIYRELAEHRGLFDVSDDNHWHISGLSQYFGTGEEWIFFGLNKQLSEIPSSVFENEERRAIKSNNSFLLIESGSTSYFYNCKGDSIIKQFDDNTLHWAALSSSGHYIVATNVENNEIDCYHLTNDFIGGRIIWGMEWMKSLSGTAGNYVFKNNVEFAMINGDKLEIRSVEAMTPENGNGDGLILSTETSATRVVETDPLSNTLLTCSAEHLFIYDLTDLSLLGKIPNTIIYQKVIQRGPQQVAYLNSAVFYMDEGAAEATMQPLPIDKWREQ